ncbi:hypothetical protein [Nitrosomonas mobilis]|uniref:Uncharacterized protein n=1 Tax=Nitrosomonas mobilis TaxID=51642 RepID=A0A1G5SCE8_9PROT|nr:hypothetical protein [Nitrosomonas mobilis]SCZ84221.1 conserved hypothetical protein [Nitrosomonas mobilis]
MEFFSGFKWAVPRAFSDAVALCRFEEGDILYDTKKAYNDDWEKASQFIEHSLQVKYPARAVSGGATEKGGGVFGSNWGSEVCVDLYKNLKKVGVGQIHTTQGRLYTALWKGDITVLEKESEEPAIPLSVQDVTKTLDQATEKAKELSVGYPVFVMARDLSNPVSREKFSKILMALKKHPHNQPSILAPKKAGLSKFEDIAPTVDIAFFPMNGTSAEELHELVKRAVYVPATNTKKEKFRILAHGIIV